MQITTTSRTPQSTHPKRLREAVKRLVIELGYLEHCIAAGVYDADIRTAATGLDTAIEALNNHLR